MYMKKYGKMLMNEDSEKTTELLKCLCTDYRPSDSEWLASALCMINILPVQTFSTISSRTMIFYYHNAC